jgi:hypothetical protein
MSRILFALIALVAMVSAVSALDTSALDKAGVDYLVVNNLSIVVKSADYTLVGAALATMAVADEFRETRQSASDAFDGVQATVTVVSSDGSSYTYNLKRGALMYLSQDGKTVDSAEGYLMAMLQA